MPKAVKNKFMFTLWPVMSAASLPLAMKDTKSSLRLKKVKRGQKRDEPKFPSSQGTPVCVHLVASSRGLSVKKMRLCYLVWSFLPFPPLVIILLFLEENKK